jgi:hypothetical protein
MSLQVNIGQALGFSVASGIALIALFRRELSKDK